ncbi:sterol desaturase family protein [Pontibacter sp. KCTC 32443]|uniref:sterol desaturase family protein n=1 Tax=Pontibacter TaxID=323449 RepID=UPI00164D7D1E|nr:MULTISPECIES: sterol desaturase family protein [Pontibacter]MBC5772939.1 sterol desaturase family protein [Pontibacter sp. KCTC 32443]
MEKKLYTWDDLEKLDDLTIIKYIAPVIVVLVLAEWLIGYYKNRNYYDKRDAFVALAIGVGNAVLGAALKISMLTAAMVIYNMVPWAMPRVWWVFIVCFVTVDFCRYWAHRISHEQRFWWATHVTHHSSTKMNFLVSLRTSWFAPLKIIFFLPVPLLGIDLLTFFVCHQLAVLYQFFVHTELIKKLPAPVEYIFVTPSHHRVHHGSNPKYIDRNYGSTFIIWDRIFHTFEPETEQPVYGLTTPVKSYNPVFLVFHEWVAIFRDLYKCSSIKEAFQLLFYPPGTKVTAQQQSAHKERQTQVKSLETALLKGKV